MGAKLQGRFVNRPYKVHPEGEKIMESLGIDYAILMPKRHAIALERVGGSLTFRIDPLSKFYYGWFDKENIKNQKGGPG
jgi:hypothetical protein